MTTSLEQKSHRCSNCGAELTLNQNDHSVTCIYCGFQEELGDRNGGEELFYNMYDDLEIPFMSKKAFSKKCAGCSAEITTTLQTIANVCPFCQSTNFIDETAEKSILQPQNISPFRIEEADLPKLFETWKKSKKYAPNKFKKEAKLSPAFTAVYYPFWTFDIDSTFTFSGTAKGKKGTSPEIKWSGSSGSIEKKEDDVLMPAHRALSQEIIDTIDDWDLKRLSRFTPALINKYQTLNYELEYKRAYQLAKTKVERQRKREAKRAVEGSNSYKISFNNEKTTFKFILLPIILASYTYQGETYPLYINGESGTVGGGAPISKLKANFILYLITAIVILGILALFSLAL